MRIELANHDPVARGINDDPKITSIVIPEYDDGSTHPLAEYNGPHPHDARETGTLLKAGPKLGGYTHAKGKISVDEFRSHLGESLLQQGERRGITHLPDHEILLSVLHPDGAWGYHGKEAPRWVQVHGDAGTPKGQAADVESFLSEYWSCPTARDYFRTEHVDEVEIKKELAYWTRHGAPGVFPQIQSLPDAKALFTNNGRVIANYNDGGGVVGAIGVGSAATGTSFTVSGTPGWASNQMVGCRIVAYSTTSNNMVWGNITANGTGTNPSITVDRWYNAATPGGSAATTPTTPWAFMIIDGGFTSAWFIGLATGANAATATDTTLNTNGNTEIVTAGGGLVRKIAPYAQTSGVASRALTLTPVFTANGTDSLPATVTTMGAHVSMVVSTTGTMKYETPLTPSSATLSANGDQLTVTETITGS